jgi:1-acyl-sn-glycerol-3-phosphate acyltransferase
MLDALAWLTYEFFNEVLTVGLTLGWGLRVKGRNNVPQCGPALIVANHQSFLDPPTIGTAVPGHIAYMARKTLFKNPAFGFLIRTVHAVPIDQEGIGIDGIKAILERLRQGWRVLVFPEGARTPDGRMQALAPGISLLIKRAGCPIVPAGIAGAYQAYPRGALVPRPAPLFLPPSERSIAVSFGRPRPAESIAGLPRAEMLKVLAEDIAAQVEVAESIRRKPRRREMPRKT